MPSFIDLLPAPVAIFPSTRAGLIRALQAEKGLPLNYHFRTRLAIGRPTRWQSQVPNKPSVSRDAASHCTLAYHPADREMPGIMRLQTNRYLSPDVHSIRIARL